MNPWVAGARPRTLPAAVVPVAVVLAILALSRIKRSGDSGRGLAIASLVQLLEDAKGGASTIQADVRTRANRKPASSSGASETVTCR